MEPVVFIICTCLPDLTFVAIVGSTGRKDASSTRMFLSLDLTWESAARALSVVRAGSKTASLRKSAGCRMASASRMEYSSCHKSLPGATPCYAYAGKRVRALRLSPECRCFRAKLTPHL
jgi:hypothetical protein